MGIDQSDIDVIARFGHVRETVEYYTKVMKYYGFVKKEDVPIDATHRIVRLKNPDGHEVFLDVETALANSSSEMLLDGFHQFHYQVFGANPTDARYVTPFTNYVLAETHRYKDSVHFEKTRNKVLTGRLKYQSREKPCKFEDSYYYDDPKIKEFFDKRCQETYTRAPIKLNVKKEDFFANDGVNYEYDHDELHKVVAIDEMPAYSKIKNSESDVMCNREMWNHATENVKIACVLEESWVIALERRIIPMKMWNATREEQFDAAVTALQKICTTLTSGWFRDYAWQNYGIIKSQLIDPYKTYLDRFNNSAIKATK